MSKIQVSSPVLSGNELRYVKDCIKTNWISSGKYLELLEKQFAKFCQVLHASSCSNGTSALHLALLALGVNSNDEVLVPDLTYVSTANAVSYTGAKPVFVDVDKDTWTIDPKKIEEKITKKTKAIIPVHLFGHPADMDVINKIARKYKLSVIEDACQAHGSTYKGKKIGSLSDVGCFSFSGAKVITSGEGGMLVSKNAAIIKKAIDIRSNCTSKTRRFYHNEIGHNYRLTNIQAAIGLAQLENVDEKLKKKISNARLYNELLKDLEIIQLPTEKPWAKNTYWLYSIVLKKSNLRDKMIIYLDKKGIETRPFFYPLHKLPMYLTKEKFPVAEYLGRNGISLPSSASLTQKEIRLIASEIRKFLKNHA